jgi:hypothetical protein
MADDVRFQRANEVPAQNGASALVVLAWLFVLVPLLWGVTQTLVKSVALFK